LTAYANEGLRTLLAAEREISPKEYEAWHAQYNKANCAVNDRQRLVDEVSEKIEHSFKLIGSTAIEDKLQEDVGEVIHDIKQAGVKLWVLTGDKIETAINIGFSCKLIDVEMEVMIIDEDSTKAIYK
jgi:magnesium-transporting ATPase (P-type)